MAEEELKPPNRVAEDGFKNRTVLVTGASGFMGKVLLEKLLRTCPHIKTIYAIIRSKKGIKPQARINDIFANPLFDLLKTAGSGEVLKKVIAIPGDLSKKDLGICKKHWDSLIKEVEIIYHLSATTRFDEPLKKAVLFNSRSTKLLLQLAKQCRNLLVFVHVSTAYCFPHEKVLHETTYSFIQNPHEIIKNLETLDEEAVAALSEELMRGCPNTYTFSKALAEDLVKEEMDNLPVLIMRPSVVIPIWRDPLPGWVDNMNGPVGLLIASGKGILRTIYCKSNRYTDLVPVDVAVNVIIFGVYHYMRNKQKRIYNITTSSKMKATWSEIVQIGKSIIGNEMPLNWVVWYPEGHMTSYRWLHKVSAIFLHYVPALVLDTIILLSGNKPVLWRIYRKLHKGLDALEYYMNNRWEFKNENVLELNKFMNETERGLYQCDVDGFHIDEYFYNCIHGARLYILKEEDESLPRAKLHMKMMWMLDRFCKIVFIFFVLHLFLNYLIYPMIGENLDYH